MVDEPLGEVMNAHVFTTSPLNESKAPGPSPIIPTRGFSVRSVFRKGKKVVWKVHDYIVIMATKPR